MNNLQQAAHSLGIEITDEQSAEFEKYMEMMLEYNKCVNLTAITEKEEIEEKHFVDSVSAVLSERLHNNCSLIDIGAGAGFPSLPIKIVRKDIDVTMLDSLNKRINFLNSAINELHLEKIRAIHMRAEDGGRKAELREKFDVAVARAVADLSVLAEYALPFVKKGGYFIAMKGPSVDGELDKAKNAIKLLGGKTREVKKIKLPSGIEHSLVIIEKTDSTPSKYPRKAGKPVKEPLS